MSCYCTFLYRFLLRGGDNKDSTITPTPSSSASTPPTATTGKPARIAIVIKPRPGGPAITEHVALPCLPIVSRTAATARYSIVPGRVF